MKKKKRKLNKWVLVSLIILVILGLLSISVVSLMANPKYVIKQSIMRTFNSLEKMGFDDAKTWQLGTTITLGGSVLDEGLDKDSFKVNVIWDEVNDNLQVSGSVLEDNKKILNGTYLYSKEKNYVASDDLFKNIYNIDEYDCKDKNDLICFLKLDDGNLKNSLDIDESNVSLDRAIAELEKALEEAVTKDNTYRNKGSFKDEVKDYNKYTYKIDKETLNNIYEKLGTDSRYYLYLGVCLTDKDCDDLAKSKDSIEEKLKSWNDVLEINIYTDGLFNKFKALEIGNSNTFVNLYYNKDNQKMSVSLPEKKIRVESTKSDNKQVTTIYFKEVLVGTLNYQKEDKENTLDYRFSFLGFSLDGKISNKANKHNDYTDGILDMSMNMDAIFFKTDLTVAFDYNLANKISIPVIDTSKALDYNEMTTEDKEMMDKTLDDFKKSNIGKILGLFDREDISDDLLNNEI